MGHEPKILLIQNSKIGSNVEGGENLMQANWRIGSLFGIPLFLDPSWLFIFGGVASIDRESKTPSQAFQVAISGPAVSFGLFGLLYSLAQVLPSASVEEVLALDLANINLILGAFNLIPGLPLDGGQVLKAAIWKLTGSRFQGVRWAAQTGKILGGVTIAIGLFFVLKEGQPFAIWLALIGGFVFRNATAYERLATLQEALLQVTASETMTREFRVVDANQTLRSFT